MTEELERSAFDDFYRSELDGQVRRAFLLIGSSELANDIVHDAMIGVYRHWATIERPAAYLNRAVLNGCRDAGRRATRQRRLVHRLAEEPVDASPREVLDDVLAALPFNQRAAVVLRYFESMPTAEIAIALNCAPGSVGPWIDRALTTMRKALAVGAVGAGSLASARTREDASPTDRPAAVAVAPTTNDYWYEAYGFWLCGSWTQLRGSLEEQGADQAAVARYFQTGIHSRDDGIIHIHPFTPAGEGANATVARFLEVYGVTLNDESLTMPPDQDGGVSSEGGPGCDGAAAQLSVVVWSDPADEASSTTYTRDFDTIPLLDGAAVTIAFAPKGSVIPQPPSVGSLATVRP